MYAFLFKQSALNLTPIEIAATTDSYIAWMELQPPNKQEALAWLDQQDALPATNGTGIPPEQQLPQPDRNALVLLLEGQHKPPRVTQVCTHGHTGDTCYLINTVLTRC